ncbi:MAG: hypothetical protein ACYC2P_03660 [Paludibacteraceae bacterium]
MIQEVVFTTLPNQRIEADKKQYLKLSVYVSAHLKNFADLNLGGVPDMFDWPEKILNTEFRFRISGVKSDIPAELNKTAIDKELYRNIFHENIKIDKFEMENLHLKPVQSFPVVHIQNFLLEQAKKAAIESPSQLLPVTSFIDPEKLGIISDSHIDSGILDISGKRQPRAKPIMAKSFIIKDDASVKALQSTLRTKRFIPFKNQADPRIDFIQLKDFHKTGTKITEKLVIRKPQFEFHNILSVLNSYPELMCRLGFILDFIIPYDSSIPSSGTIQLVPQNIKFSENNTKVSVPKTAYSITSTGFYAADKANSIIKKGFVKINTSGFSVVQMDTDGLALKTAQTVDEKTIQIADYFERKNLSKINTETSFQNLRLRTEASSTGSLNTAKAGLVPVKNLKTSGSSRAELNYKPVLSFQKMKPLEKMKLVEVPDREGLHAIRTAGIALIRNGMSQDVAEKLQRNSNFQKTLIDNAKVDSKIANLILPEEILYSDDLVMAYRMDIAYEENPGKWYSLHSRKMHYSWFDEAGTEHPVDKINPDEGYIELGIIEKENDPDNIYVPETLARWEGWSLSVGKPGLAINDSEENPAKNPKDRHDFFNSSREIEMKKYRFDPTLDFRFNAQSDLVPGTLPKLRFGKSYRIRVRTVDMAGNSVPLEFESESLSETQCKNISYFRYEPLSNPIVLVGNKLRDGEFLEQMVIRSNYDVDVEKYEKKNAVNGQDSNGLSLRYLLPPKNSQQMAETHGYFEKAFSDPQKAKEIYQIITSHEGLYERNPDNTERIYTEDQAKIIYLPDPMAAGIAIFADTESENTHTENFTPRMFSFFSKEELSPDTTNKITIPEDWYNTQAIKLKLDEGKLEGTWDGKNRTFTVKLPKGQRIKLKISTFWREDDMKRLSAIWQLVKSNAGVKLNEIEKIAKSGQHWMISPSRTFELVHAVQQPIEAPSLLKIEPERDYDDTSASLNVRFNVHGESTDFAELKATWTEPLDDGISVEIKEKNFNDSIPEIDVYYLDKTITLGAVNDNPKPGLSADRFKIREPQWKTDPVRLKQFDIQPGSPKISTIYKIQAEKLSNIHKTRTTETIKNPVAALNLDIEESKLNLVKMLDLRIYPLEHAFGNTRHRWVNYSIIASSRYSEYFINIKKKKPEISFIRESNIEKINILSSARPDKPEIDYVIPAFEWQKTDHGSNMTHIRKGGVLRVYLKRPWFSSGDEEKLAVILPDSGGNSGMISIMGATPGYSDFYTHWGADPLFVSELPGKLSPLPADFRFNPIIEKGLIYPGQNAMKATAVAYPVTFDKEKQLWYADIALNTANMYFPFIRLALARYQQHSLRISDTDVCLSDVVMAGMIQMVPERKASITLKPSRDQMAFNFKLSGPTYNHKSSKFGIREVIKLTVLDSEFAQPVQGVIINSSRISKFDNETSTFEVGRNMKEDNYFEINEDVILPETYKTKNFQVIIEEVELGPQSLNNLPDMYKERLEHPEETNRVVYADVFDIENKR